MATTIEIIGVGAFIPVEGSDGPRPIGHGAVVKVDKALADQLIADGVAAKPGDVADEHGDEKPLADRSRDELNEIAVGLGIEDPDKLPNKGAVVEAIEAAQAASAPVA